MSRVHGISDTRIYKIWSGMKQRCYNPNNCHYARYGGRGITVCDQWRGPDGAIHFYEWAMSHGYKDSLSIDRVDNDQGYSPENCVWASSATNTCSNHLETKIFFAIVAAPTFEEEYIKKHI